MPLAATLHASTRTVARSSVPSPKLANSAASSCWRRRSVNSELASSNVVRVIIRLHLEQSAPLVAARIGDSGERLPVPLGDIVKIGRTFLCAWLHDLTALQQIAASHQTGHSDVISPRTSGSHLGLEISRDLLSDRRRTPYRRRVPHRRPVRPHDPVCGWSTTSACSISVSARTDLPAATAAPKSRPTVDRRSPRWRSAFHPPWRDGAHPAPAAPRSVSAILYRRRIRWMSGRSCVQAPESGLAVDRPLTGTPGSACPHTRRPRRPRRSPFVRLGTAPGRARVSRALRPNPPPQKKGRSAFRRAAQV